MPLFSESLKSWTSVADTFCAFYANQPNSFWLDRKNHPAEHFSVIGVGTQIDDPQLYLEEEEIGLPFGFRPYLVGVLPYTVEPGNISQTEFLLVDRAMVFDHSNRDLYFVGRFETRSEFEAWYHAALLRLALLGGNSAAYALDNPAATASELIARDNRDTYLRAIERAKQHISAGDVYQICLTTQLEGDYVGDELSYFLRLRRQNPAPYASYLKLGGRCYVSISPERLISVLGNQVLSSPIKGTRRRSANPIEDRNLALELETSEKERAENLMIVDLVRNDLSVVCEPESITVTDLLTVRSYSTVHQLVSDIKGQLKPTQTGIDALRALFPAGSMTGAPKRRAMELLEQLESGPRGGYAGGIGWVGPNGQLELGMVIRTAIFENNSVKIGVGGGITSDSDPAHEHQEIQIKAQALVSALSASVRW